CLPPTPGWLLWTLTRLASLVDISPAGRGAGLLPICPFGLPKNTNAATVGRGACTGVVDAQAARRAQVRVVREVVRAPTRRSDGVVERFAVLRALDLRAVLVRLVEARRAFGAEALRRVDLRAPVLRAVLLRAVLRADL